MSNEWTANRRRIVAATFFFLLLGLASSATAQTCEWGKVKSWTGHYEIKGIGTVTQPEGVYTLNTSASASFGPIGQSGACPGPFFFFNPVDSAYSASANNLFQRNPCGLESLVGTGGGNSTTALQIDPVAGTYSFVPNPWVNFLETIDYTACGSNEFTNTGTFFLADLGSPWPLTFPLPGSVQVLHGDISFEAAEPWRGIVTPFTFTFTLIPDGLNDEVDNPCSQSGGSVIACQNQSLGEDVPIVGTDFSLHYQSDRLPGRSDANPIAKADALATAGWTINVHHAYDPSTNALFLGDGVRRSTWQLAGSMTYNGNTLVTSQDGTEIYLFDLTTGRHLQTLKPLTGALKYQFSYDAFGKLISIKDGSNNVTTIQRDGSGRPTTIVSPFAQTTSLTLDANGFLSQATDPAGHTFKFTNTAGGLMTSRTDSNGNTYTYTYDNSDRLTKDSDPAGGFVSLSRTDTALGYDVTMTTALGRTTTYQVATGTPGEHFTNILPSGLQATSSATPVGSQLVESMGLPDGTISNSTLSADPRWGLQAPLITNRALTLGTLTANSTFTRAITLGTPGNPFSLLTQSDTEAVNGRPYQSVFTTAKKTYVDTTPEGRTTTRTLDSLERIRSIKVGPLLPIKIAYDQKGYVSTISHGTRVTKLAYDSKGFLSTVTDPMNLTTTFTRDLAGRLLTKTLPDNRVIGYAYDANGNLTSITPPGKPAHDFSYDSVDQASAYNPPGIAGTGPTTYVYNADRELTSVGRPDGQTVTFHYDNAMRVSSIVTPAKTVDYAYDAATGNLASASVTGEVLTYGYNGPLPTSSAWSGTVVGSIRRNYDNNFWMTSLSINGGNTINFVHDNDGLLTKAGSLILKRDLKDGVVKISTLGKVKETRGYNTFGEPSTYSLKYGATVLYNLQLTRDVGGRIAQKTETIGGQQTVYAYSYDPSSRLVGVSQNGLTSSTYTYDTNSNRLAAVTPSGTFGATYDAQDRLLTYGTTSFTYTGNGELASQTAAGQTTTYSYDAFGNLLSATLHDGTNITYVVDGQNRRVGRKVNGVLQTGFLYDGNQLVAELDGSNQIVSQFVYGNKSNHPDYMIRGGITYRIFCDYLGSPRLVVNVTTSAITQKIDFDEFGNVINDTNPGFQPFGFAGGLYDQNTHLVRLGARDYLPTVGRWTAKDPIRFAGSDTNLYGYVLLNPVNLTDSSGLCPDWLKDLLKKVFPNKVKLGPIDLSTEKPEISTGVSVSVSVEGQEVASASGKVAVGIRTEGGAGDDLFYVDGTAQVDVLGHTVAEAHYHAEGGNASHLQHTQNIISNAKKANNICEDSCPASQ